MTPSLIGFVVEDFDALEPSWDNSLLFGREFRRRGHRVVYAPWRNLILGNDGLRGVFFENKFETNGDPRGGFGPPERIDFRELDLCLLRMDPPFDLRYLTATYMLEYANTRVLNDPKAIRAYNEKISVYSYPKAAPLSRVVMSEGAAFEAIESAPDIAVWIAKPTNAFGGIGVVRFEAGDVDAATRLMRESSRDWTQPLMLQEFNARVSEGDKRIFLLEGRPIGWVNRVPKPGEYLANIHAGAITVPFDLSASDLDICDHIAREFPKDALPLICIDVIGDRLSEINVTCPSGLIQINRAMEKRCELEIVDYFEGRIATGPSA